MYRAKLNGRSVGIFAFTRWFAFEERRGGFAADREGAPGELALILADTDVLIDFLIGVQPVKDQMAGYINSGQLKAAAITCFELLSGAGENKRGRAVRQLLASIEVLPLDRAPRSVRQQFAASLSALAKQLEWVTV